MFQSKCLHCFDFSLLDVRASETLVASCLYYSLLDAFFSVHRLLSFCCRLLCSCVAPRRTRVQTQATSWNLHQDKHQETFLEILWWLMCPIQLLFCRSVSECSSCDCSKALCWKGLAYIGTDLMRESSLAFQLLRSVEKRFVLCHLALLLSESFLFQLVVTSNPCVSWQRIHIVEEFSLLALMFAFGFSSGHLFYEMERLWNCLSGNISTVWSWRWTLLLKDDKFIKAFKKSSIAGFEENGAVIERRKVLVDSEVVWFSSKGASKLLELRERPSVGCYAHFGIDDGEILRDLNCTVSLSCLLALASTTKSTRNWMLIESWQVVVSHGKLFVLKVWYVKLLGGENWIIEERDKTRWKSLWSLLC